MTSTMRCAECGAFPLEWDKVAKLEATIRQLRALLLTVSDQDDYNAIWAAIQLLGGNP